MPLEQEKKTDYRVYIGLLLMHWKLLVACLLYALLGAILYLQFAPKTYEAHCTLMIYRDPNLQIASSRSPWDSFASHAFLLQADTIKRRAADNLREKWSAVPDRHRIPAVVARRGRGLASTIAISARGPDRGYAVAFLSELIKEHKSEWQSIQMKAVHEATGTLLRELNKLENEIGKAEEKLIEYQRLHDIARVEAKGSMESRYLMALMQRRNQMSTELMLLESQHTFLQDAEVGVIRGVAELTRETGLLAPLPDDEAEGPWPGPERESIPLRVEPESRPAELSESERGWQDLRVRLARLRETERELAGDLRPEHPQLVALRKEIQDVRDRLDVAAQVEAQRLKDRHESLRIQIKALAAAEHKWQSRNLLASQRRTELNRIAAVVDRYVANHRTLYGRYHDLLASSELRAEHFEEVTPVTASPQPVWPDPSKILLIALALGFGSGLGLTLVLEVLNNRVQTVRDVEDELGVPFLGGVPHWVHSGLERMIRPVVTEENSEGAIEAYRTLRVGLLSALDKTGEKIVIMTSADSREGKTLTSLNLAIMIGQTGKKTLLVDMDIRRGRLHRSFGMEKEPGVTDMLRKRQSMKDAVMRTGFDNLDFVPSGSSAHDCAELLQSVGLATLIGDLKDVYDCILIDTSPVLRVTDTSIVAGQGIGVVVYVARVNRTPKPLIRYSMDMLKDARIVGLIMNDIEMHKIGSLYYSYMYPNYAYYSYAYSYGSDYYHYGDGGSHRRPRRRTGVNVKINRLKKWLRQMFLPLD